MIVVFAHTGGLVAGEVAVAAGASALSQKMLEAVLGDQAVAVARGARPGATSGAGRAAARGGARAASTDRLDAVGVHEGAGAALRAAVQDVEDAA